VWFIGAVISFLLNRDLFSPVKLYYLSLLLYFYDIFFNPYSAITNIIYFIYIALGVFFALLEFILSNNTSNYPNTYGKSLTINLNLTVIFIWILSIAPIIAQIYLINIMGGIEGYMLSIGYRFEEWRGLGLIIIIIRSIYYINAVYLILLIKNNKTHAVHWFFYSAHIFLYLTVGLLSGSWGFIAEILLLKMIYNYIKRRFKMRELVLYGSFLLLIAVSVGFARNNIKLGEGKVIAFLDDIENYSEYVHIGRYGLDPVELVFNHMDKDLKYGTTFLSGITNFVPRIWWPDKPSSGGVVLTIEYADDAWFGASNLSTGIIAESVINFGEPIGTVFGFSVLCSFMIVVIKIYTSGIIRSEQITDLEGVFRFLLYLVSMKIVAYLPVIEFANGVYVFISSALSFLLIFIVLLALRRSGRSALIR